MAEIDRLCRLVFNDLGVELTERGPRGRQLGLEVGRLGPHTPRKHGPGVGSCACGGVCLRDKQMLCARSSGPHLVLYQCLSSMIHTFLLAYRCYFPFLYPWGVFRRSLVTSIKRERKKKYKKVGRNAKLPIRRHIRRSNKTFAPSNPFVPPLAPSRQGADTFY